MLTRKLSAIEIISRAITLVLLVSVFLKAVVNLDTGYDTGWYHHVFAARIWGIIPRESFETEKLVEYRYDGFPLLIHFFQGMFWKLTGRMQAANLVGYFSVLIYLFFLRSFFQVPLYLSAIAIFTIPAVLTHATTSFVDLPGNIGVAVTIMMFWQLCYRTKLPIKTELLAVFLGAVVAANSKPQLTVLIFVVWCGVMVRLATLYAKNFDSYKGNRILIIILSLVASVLIFATPVKNISQYGNPLYPIKIEVAGVVLNHKAVPKTYQEGDRPQKWLRSIFEINTPEWTTDQYNYSENPRNLDRAGGFFGAYVIFNLMLLLTLIIRILRKRERLYDKSVRQIIFATVIISVSSVFAANFPQSHELRYFMFWMIVLVSLNLCLLHSLNVKLSGRSKNYLYLIYLAFLFVMCIKIDSYYLRPVFKSVSLPPRGYTSAEQYVRDAVKPELIEQMIPNQRICLIARPAIPDPEAVPYASIANAIFYAAHFHPEVEYDYSIQAVTNKKGCGDLKMLPNNIKRP